MNLKALIGLFGIICLVIVNTAQARPHRHHNHNHKHVVVEKVVVKPAPLRTVVANLTDVRSTLPVSFVRVVHAGETYYYADGIYYVKQPRGYVAVRPVAGIKVAHLPAGHVKVRIGSDTLYRFNDVYYRRDNGIYIVV